MPSIPKVSLRKARATDDGENRSEQKPARSGFFKRNRKSEGDDVAAPNKSLRRKESQENTTEPREKKSWFGMFDGLTHKPPKNQPSGDSDRESSAAAQARPAAGPTPIKSGASVPSTRDYDDEDESDSRPMSKAERKRLRRQQDDRRAA